MQIDFANLQHQHNLYKDEIENAILKVARDCNFIMGSQIDELERDLEKFTGSKYAISCSSGTTCGKNCYIRLLQQKAIRILLILVIYYH